MKDQFIIESNETYDEPNPKGLGCELFEKMALNRNKLGQICCTTGIMDTFGDMLMRAKRVAIELKKRKIQKNDIILLCTDNQINDSIVWIASQFLCCIIATIDSNISTNDITLLLNRVTPNIIFVVPEAVYKIEEAIRTNNIDVEIVVFGETEENIRFESFLQPSFEEEKVFAPEACANIKDTAVIVFSSGSTGLPKGICLSHYGLLCQSQLKTLFAVNNRFLTFSNLYWISTINFLLANVYKGSVRIIPPKFEVDTFWRIVKEFKVKRAFLPPHMLLDIIDDKIPNDLNETSLEAILTGGSSITGQQILIIRQHLPNIDIYQALGQTEISGITTYHDIDNEYRKKNMLNKPDSCGCLRSGITCKIVNPDTEETLGPNQTGEMRIKSNFLMNGYYKMDRSDCYDENGWFKTGDLMYYDNDKYFYHVDRVKEIFKFKQIHIQPVLLEDILLSHPAVLKAAVIGIPDSHDGHHPMGVVILKKNMENVTEDEIKEYFDEKVDEPKKLRGGLKILNDFPITVTGKVLRREIRKMLIGY